MAVQQSVNYEVRISALHNRTDDNVSQGNDQVVVGSDGFPEIKLAFNESSSAPFPVDAMTHGNSTIAAGGNATITLASLMDRMGVAFAPVAIKYAVFAIQSPDGTKKARVGPLGDAGAVNFGMDSAGYVEFTHAQPFCHPYGGWTTPITKVLINNPGAASITVAWLLVGKR